jgi:hypothetical protein
MPRRTILQTSLAAALAASALAASPALAEPFDPSNGRFDNWTPDQPTTTRTWSPGDDLRPYHLRKESSKAFTIKDGRSPDTRDAAKDAAIQPGQPTWPVNPKVLTPPRPEGSTRGGSTDNDDIWLVVGLGLAGAALAGGAAGAARYSRVRARRVAV